MLSSYTIHQGNGIQKHNTKSDDILLDIPSWCFVYPWFFHLIMAFPTHSIQLRPKTNAGFTALSAGLGRMIMLTKCLSKLLFLSFYIGLVVFALSLCRLGRL